jgi:TRAP-type C4-dicarboxylate transport system substrate-binding protein
MKSRYAVSAIFFGLLAMILATAPIAAQTTLSAASAFPRGHPFSVKFEKFIEEVNQRSKGTLVIDYKGGAPAIGSPFTLGQRLQRGQFDIMGNTGPYYESILPEALSLTLAERSIQELRQNGAMKLINEVHATRGMYVLGRTMEYVPFFLYLRKPVETANLNGYRVRVPPHLQPFFGAVNAATVRADLSEIYTFMENGSIDGFGWPQQGFLPDWLKVVKYRLEPGFYNADIHIILNLTAWNKLSPEHRKLMEDLMIELEATNKAESDALNAAAFAAQDKAGVQVIKLNDVEAKKWLTTARDTVWKALIERAPESGPKLRKLMTKAED